MEEVFIRDEEMELGDTIVMKFGVSMPVKIMGILYVLNFVLSLVTSIISMSDLDSNPLNGIIKFVLILSLLIGIVVPLGFSMFIVGSMKQDNNMTYNGLNILHTFYMIMFVFGLLGMIGLVLLTLLSLIVGFKTFIGMLIVSIFMYFIIKYYSKLASYFEDLKSVVRHTKKYVGPINYIVIFSGVYATIITVLFFVFIFILPQLSLPSEYSALKDAYSWEDGLTFAYASLIQFMIFYVFYYFRKEYSGKLKASASDVKDVLDTTNL